MSEAVAARAAVIDAGERASADGAGGSWHLTKDGSCRMVWLVTVLPPGRRAAEIGREILKVPGAPGKKDAGLGPAQRIEPSVPNWAAEILFWAGKERHDGRDRIPGPMDVPVWVDPATGAIVDIARDQLVEELMPLRDEGVWLWKRTESLFSPVRAAAGTPGLLGRFGGSVLKEWKAAIVDLKADMTSSKPMHVERPNDSTHPPIEGVGYERWIYVKALLVRDEVHPSHVDLYTHYRHIPWQRWAAIDAAWSQRQAADPQLHAWADYDLRRMKPSGALWEQGY